MDHIHGLECVKTEMNLHPYISGGLSNGISEASQLLSVDQVKLEDNSSVEELCSSECRNDEEDNKSFQEEFVEGRMIYTRENFILAKSLKSEDDPYLSIDEVKLEENSCKGESSLSECRNDDEDSKNFQDEFIDGEKIWKREDFISQESGVLRCDEMHEGSLETRQRRFEGHINRKCETTYRGTLEQIKDVHLTLKNYDCYCCDYTTSRRGDLKLHINSAHLKLKKHKCHLCEYSAIKKSLLKSHIDRLHLKCHICDYATAKKGDLRIHIESVHLKLINHQCQQCEFKTTVSRNLKRHIKRVHLKIKKHKCNFCEYTTDRKIHLISHINSVHQILRNHKCHMCEYSTNEETHLKLHINIVHLKLENHKCHICNYISFTKFRLKAHIEAVHQKVQNHKCRLCEFTTYYKPSFERHINSVHLKLKK